MSNPNVLTQGVLDEAKQAREIFAGVCKQVYEEHGQGGLVRLLLEIAMDDAPINGFLTYELLTNYIDKFPKELRPMYEAQIQMERDRLAKLLDALEMGIIPNAPSTTTLQ